MKAVGISMVLCLALMSSLFGAGSKISPDLQRMDPNTTVRVIVQYKQTTPVSSQTGQLGEVLTSVGGVVDSVLPNINAVVVTVPASSLQRLASDPNVHYISRDRSVAGQHNHAASTSTQAQRGRPN